MATLGCMPASCQALSMCPDQLISLSPVALHRQEAKILAAMDAAAKDGGVVIIEHSGMLEASFTAKLAVTGRHSATADGHGWHLVLLTNKPQNLKKAALDFETICLEPAQVGCALACRTSRRGLALLGPVLIICRWAKISVLPCWEVRMLHAVHLVPGSRLSMATTTSAADVLSLPPCGERTPWSRWTRKSC